MNGQISAVERIRRQAAQINNVRETVNNAQEPEVQRTHITEEDEREFDALAEEPMARLDGRHVVINYERAIDEYMHEQEERQGEENEGELQPGSPAPANSGEERLAEAMDMLEEAVEEHLEQEGEENAVVEQPEEESEEEKVYDPHFLKENMARFSSAEWFKECQNHTVIIAGQGGIGSYVTFLMSRIEPKALYIFDPDNVELVNMAGQLYRRTDVGMPKCEAIANTVKEYSTYQSVFASNTYYDESSLATDIMISGFDSMKSRRTFFENWIRHVYALPEEERHRCLLVDGRLAAELLQVLCIRGDQPYFIDEYEKKYLFTDEEINVEGTCSYKQTAFMANMIAGIMVNCYVNHCAFLVSPDTVRSLPFFMEYEASSMNLRQTQMIY